MTSRIADRTLHAFSHTLLEGYALPWGDATVCRDAVNEPADINALHAVTGTVFSREGAPPCP